MTVGIVPLVPFDLVSDAIVVDGRVESDSGLEKTVSSGAVVLELDEPRILQLCDSNLSYRSRWSA